MRWTWPISSLLKQARVTRSEASGNTINQPQVRPVLKSSACSWGLLTWLCFESNTFAIGRASDVACVTRQEQLRHGFSLRQLHPPSSKFSHVSAEMETKRHRDLFWPHDRAWKSASHSTSDGNESKGRGAVHSTSHPQLPHLLTDISATSSHRKHYNLGGSRPADNYFSDF